MANVLADIEFDLDGVIAVREADSVAGLLCV